MSDRLSDEGLAEVRRKFENGEEIYDPEMESLLDEVRELRADDGSAIELLHERIAELEQVNREMRKALESGETDSAESEHMKHLQSKIAELEEREMAAVNGRREFRAAFRAAREKLAAREAQLANLRRTVESWSDRGMVLVSDVLAELDEVGIPTAPPEAEVDPREDEE